MVQSMNKVFINDLIFHNKGIEGLFLNTVVFRFWSGCCFIARTLNASEKHYWSSCGYNNETVLKEKKNNNSIIIQV